MDAQVRVAKHLVGRRLRSRRVSSYPGGGNLARTCSPPRHFLYAIVEALGVFIRVECDGHLNEMPVGTTAVVVHVVTTIGPRECLDEHALEKESQ